MKTKVLVVGSVLHSRSCLAHMIGSGANLVGVVSRKRTHLVSDFDRLDDLASEAGVPHYSTSDINDDGTLDWIGKQDPDVAFCIGWSQLIGARLLALPRMGFIGYHPSMLPRNRGRHPLIWALVLGLKETGSSFFLMDHGADSGSLLSQRRIGISADDDAASLYRKMTSTAIEQIDDLLRMLEDDQFEGLPQDEGNATTWRKRSLDDGRIDWRMPTLGIHNLIRALTRPYPGATVRLDNGEHVIWRSRPAPDDVPADIEPGRVIDIDIDQERLTVKTGDGAIVLVEHEIKPLPLSGHCL